MKATTPFAVNWQDVEAVKAYAQQLGAGRTVLTRPENLRSGRATDYQIAPTSHLALLKVPPEAVVHQT